MGRENELESKVIISNLGYTILNEHDKQLGRFGGWPDRLAIDEKDGSIHFIEIKTGKHRLDPYQEKVFEILSRFGTVHILWYRKKKFIGRTIYPDDQPPS